MNHSRSDICSSDHKQLIENTLDAIAEKPEILSSGEIIFSEERKVTACMVFLFLKKTDRKYKKFYIVMSRKSKRDY